MCSGGGAIYHYGSASAGQTNFTDDSVTNGGADIWSYHTSAVMSWCIFRRGCAPAGMVYSVYQGDVVNISDCIFMDSESPAFHSAGSTGGSFILASRCYFLNVGGFGAARVPDASILLIDCKFSNTSLWTDGSVGVTGEHLGVSSTVAIHEVVIDRECLWYGDHVPLFATAPPSRTALPTEAPTRTPTPRKTPTATWAQPTEKPDKTGLYVLGIVAGISLVALVIVIVGVIAIKRKPPEPEETIEDSMPYTDET
jgi:hypothetical protein